MKQYLRDKDGLGSSPHMTYKKNATFGTSVGGCCTLCANLFIICYLVIVLFGFCTTRNYNTQQNTSYQPIS